MTVEAKATLSVEIDTAMVLPRALSGVLQFADTMAIRPPSLALGLGEEMLSRSVASSTTDEPGELCARPSEFGATEGVTDDDAVGVVNENVRKP